MRMDCKDRLVFPVCVSAELYAKHPRGVFDLNLNDPVAEKHYKLLCFWLSVFFDHRQGTNKGSYTVRGPEGKQHYQCVLMVEMLRKSSLGMDEKINPFLVYFPPHLDDHHRLNRLVRIEGQEWHQQQREYVGSKACQVFAEQCSDGVTSEYIKRRLREPNVLREYWALKRQSSTLTRSLLSEDNFAGVRFWFIINDQQMMNLNEILQNAFANNMKTLLRKMFANKDFQVYLTTDIKKYMNSHSTTEKAKILEKTHIVASCGALLKTYRKKMSDGHKFLKENDDWHLEIFTHFDLVDLINVTLPHSSKINHSVDLMSSDFDISKAKAFTLTNMKAVGIGAVNRDFIKVFRPFSEEKKYVLRKDYFSDQCDLASIYKYDPDDP